jgi:multiple sugar transport system permease protein
MVAVLWGVGNTMIISLAGLQDIPRELQEAGSTSVPQGNYMYMINVFAQYFAYGRFGYASALLWVLFAVIVAVTVLIFKLTAGAVFYNVDPEAKR